MKAFLVTSRGVGAVDEVDSPRPGPGQVVVDVARVGVCGTDVTLFNADDDRIRHARTTYPLRLGHEWSGVVSELGEGVDLSWLGKRVTGDTMLGCGECERCLNGNHHVCENRFEIGVRGGWPGALAEKLLVPATALFALPDAVTDAMGAMVEPGGNSYRAVDAAAVTEGSRLLILGPGTIGLLCGLFGLARGAEVHILGRQPESLKLARQLGFAGTWSNGELPDLPWNAVIEATSGASMPGFAADAVEPAGRVVYIGISAEPSLVDTRTLVRKDVTAVGILGGSAGLAPTIDAYASGTVDPLPLIAETIALDVLPDELAGRRKKPVGSPPKIHVDPRIH
jgi:threonine dehydrogenase-like Zn-dependent dehydrogenase